MNFLQTKKGIIVTITSLVFSFMFMLIWVGFGYLYTTNVQFVESESKILTEQYKILFNNDVKNIKVLDSELEDDLRRVLDELEDDIKTTKKINNEYLKMLKNNYKIAGIWLIEGGNAVYLSSDGSKTENVRSWYKDRKTVDWEEKLDWLLANEGAIWVDSFHKSVFPSFDHIKTAYLSMGKIPSLDNKQIILEVGISLEDVLGKDNMQVYSFYTGKIYKNVKSIDVRPTSKPIRGIYQTRDEFKLKTSVTTVDHNGENVKITLNSDYSQKSKELFNYFIISMGATIVLMICLILLIILLRKQK